MNIFQAVYRRELAAAFLVAASIMVGQFSFAARSKGQQFIDAVSQDIMKLKKEYPQLSDFSPAKHTESEKQKVSYGYRTHRAEHAGGWTSGVPNPDPDGIWFHIDVHDPKSTDQIHTQPMTAPVCFGKDKVSFLILEGTGTKSVSGEIWKILEKHGAKQCGW